jgi:hypothetical protein
MMTANFSVNIDKNGVFTGIKMGTTIFSIQEWNKMMQSTPLNADDKDKSEKEGHLAEEEQTDVGKTI